MLMPSLPLLLTEANVRLVISKGYSSGLLRLYEDWHSKDTEHVAVSICHALLRCLHKVTYSTAGRHALLSQGGISLLHQTTQVTCGRCCILSLSYSFFVWIDDCVYRDAIVLFKSCICHSLSPVLEGLWNKMYLL